jgi:hypothetical protein
LIVRDALLFALVGAVSVSCGLGLAGTAGGPVDTDADASAPPGTSADGGTLVDSATDDASVDGPVAEAGACTTTSTACTDALAAGWTPIAFAQDRTVACPSSYTEIDLVAAPVASAGACTCACQISGADPPTCSKGLFAGLVGSSSCTGSGVSYDTNGPGCTAISSATTLSTYAKYTGPPFAAGTCTSSVVKDPAKLATSAVRGCRPPPSCAEDVCAGTGGAPFGSCVEHDGDVACPGAPFVNKTTVGATASLTCGGCASCQNSGTCGTATLHFFNDSACTTELATRLVNGACNTLATGTSGTPVSYFKYSSAVLNASCAPTSSPTTSAALDTPRTICCR